MAIATSTVPANPTIRAAMAMIRIGVVVLSAGTDGTDGPTDAAGGIVDGTTVGRARRIGLEPAGLLRRNDSYRFLDAVDDLVVTGPTFTNVTDFRAIVVDGP